MADKPVSHSAHPHPEGHVDFADPAAVATKFGPEPTDPKESAKYHAKIIEAARGQQEADKPPPDTRRFGIFASNPQKYVVLAEMVGRHLKGEEISYRELIRYRDPEHKEVDVAGTLEGADRLVALGAITPLIITGS